MVLAPSDAFLQTIYDNYTEYFADEEKECIIQQEYMSEWDREDFLSRFREGTCRGSASDKGASEEGGVCSLQGDIDLQAHIAMEIVEEDDEEENQEDVDRTLIGFCVLGGIFGEGIDLKNDSLIGAIIVGTGLPQVCFEREILKNYFDETGENGFDYSYRYPGMNKVLQAAGRVIRTMEDVGIVALLEERFLQTLYRRMFPREWENYDIVSADTIAKRVERFWDSWL